MSTIKTSARKIGPLTVWIVGHPQNPLITEVGTASTPLAVFYKRKDAVKYRKDTQSIYKVYKATIIRDGSGPDYKYQRDVAEAKLHAANKDLAANQDALTKSELAHAETEQKLLDLQKQIADGKIWNVENARLTPRTQAAMSLAVKEAEACGATYVGTEHLLLGLLKQCEGIAHRHFLASGMSYDKAEYAMRVGRHS